MENSSPSSKSKLINEEDEEESLAQKGIFTKEWHTDPPQSYTGELLHNNLHGHGFYFIGKKDKVFYDGLFYVNKLESYSQIFYGDGSHYQGLFKENRRFGPGVFTYPNGDQDVGLWNGYSLATLVVEIEGKVVPKLARTAAGKLKLLKYRNLVPVCPEEKDAADETLESLGASQEILNESYKLYNLEIENKNNVFFNKKLYDEAFHRNQDCVIDILLTEDELRKQNCSNDEEAAEEEEDLGASTLDLERIRQISERLTIINRKLEHARRMRANISDKVDYCRNCCRLNDDKDEEDDSDTVNITSSEVKSDTKDPAEMTMSASVSVSAVSSLDYTKIEIPASDKCTEVGNEEDFISVRDYLYDICVCDEDLKIDDLAMLEDQLEVITKDVAFYETIQINLRNKLDMHVKKTQETQEAAVKTKKVLVNDLLAWNNEELSMAMMKHSFLHRRKEYMVTFQVSNLLIGNRGEFACRGVHEQNCIEFLNKCCNGEAHSLVETMRKHNINVNVSDGAGNTGVFFAITNHRVNIISLLVNFGAKLDQVNGEGVTPLCLCLLLYLALKNDVTDWEKSFLPVTILPPNDENEARKWYPNKSLLSMTSHSEKESEGESVTNVTVTNVTNATKQDKLNKKPAKAEEKVEENYIFDTSFRIYVEPKKKPGVIAVRKSIAEAVENRKDNDSGKFLIQNTFGTLLECGADPNFGEVPLPPLLLSLFTRNSCLAMRLLESGANPNLTTDEDLNGLHIVASLKCFPENLSIAQVLLKYFCDPNLKCRPSHWKEQKIRLLGKNVNLSFYEDDGKNPLHLLCLRRDFLLDDCRYFEDLATLFIDYHVTANDTYLGHTALSIAVLAGNTGLVQTLLKFQDVDPYAILGYNMGNILTLFILKRYEDMLPLEKSKEMMKVLVDAYVNPLRTIGEFENAIEFMEKEHEIVIVDKGKKNKGKDKGSKGAKKDAKKGGKKGSKNSSKKGKVNSLDILQEYLKELTRDTIIKFVQVEAVENLYNFVEEDMLDYDCVKVLAEFLTPSIAFENIMALFNYAKIKACRFDRNICLTLVEFVEKCKKVVKVKKDKKGKKGKEKGSKDSSKSKKATKEPQPILEPEPNLHDMINSFEITSGKPKEILTKPGLDSRTKYQVCFHCLRKRNKALIHCPRCQFIYFCSEQCNKLNIKLKTQHICNINFYKDEKARWDAGAVNDQDNLEMLCKKALENCGERVRCRQEREREIRRRQLEEEKKLDIYGTRFLKKKVATISDRHVDGRRLTEVTLYGSKSGTDIVDHNGSKSLKRRLTSLSLFEDKYTNMLVQRHESSLKQYSVTHTNDSAPTPRVHIKSNEYCFCEEVELSEKEVSAKIKPLIKVKKNVNKKKESRKSTKEEIISKFEAMETTPEGPVVRKLRKMPEKYKYFIEMLSRYFPKNDLPFLLLPYACYSNGHLYYKMDEDVFSRTYSMV